MIRIRVDPGYNRALRKFRPELRRRADDTLAKFIADPKRPSLNFERREGLPDYYTIRISQGYRILLRKETDDEGELYAIVDAGSHDKIYRR